MNIGLIIGCPRSGTSILGELVQAHPQVRYIFEAEKVWEIGGQGEDESHRLTEAHATALVRWRIRRWFARQARGAGIVVEKCPRNAVRVPFVRAVFPEAKLIHIIRDGRDVACSLVPGMGGAQWLHARPPSWRKIYEQHSGVERCALAWREILRITREDLGDVPHLQILYSELVEKPLVTAERLMQFLGLDMHPDVAAFCQRIGNETEGGYHAAGQVQWYRNNHSRRIARWREELNGEQQQRINALLADALREVGLPIGDEPVDAAGR